MTTAYERIQTANTAITTAQRIARGTIRAGLIVGIGGVGMAIAGVTVRSPELQLIGIVGATTSAIVAAGANAVSCEIGERLDSIEVLRIDAGEARARGYREGLRDGQARGEDGCDERIKAACEQGKIEGFRSGQGAVLGVAIAERDQQIADLQCQRDRLTGELRSSQAELDSLRGAIAAKDSEIAQLSQLRRRVRAIANKEREAADRIEQARQAELDLERQKNELLRQHGELFGDYQKLEILSKAQQDELLRLENLITEMGQNHGEQLQDTADQHYAGGYQAAVAEFEKERAILTAKIDSLEAKLGHKLKLENLERNTPTLRSILRKRELQPTLVCGSQGSGKALATLEIIDILRGQSNVITLILDVSEGDDPHSSWRKAGYPVTADPKVFMSFLKRVRELLDGGDLPHRNSPNFAAQPIIIPIVDEAMSAFDSLSKEDIEWFQETMTILETRGAKRKVVPILCSIDDQIQNLTAKKVKIINTGRLKNFNFVVLNQKLRTLADDTELKSNKPLSEYLENMDGRFIAGILDYDARGSLWRPIKHPSHWLNLLTNKTPQTISQPPLAPIPHWLPKACLPAFTAAGLNPTEQPLNQSPEPLNLPQGATLKALPGGLGNAPDLGGDEGSDRAELIRRLATQGLSATAIAEQISGKKKGGSKAFLQARDEVAIVLSKGDE